MKGTTFMSHNNHDNKISNDRWTKPSKNLYSNAMNGYDLCNEKKKEKTKKQWMKKSFNEMDETLELTIAAYQNNFPKEISSKKEKLAVSKLKDPFEYPRQMNDDKFDASPEVMQFKSSQRLLAPNESIKLKRQFLPSGWYWVAKCQERDRTPQSAIGGLVGAFTGGILGSAGGIYMGNIVSVGIGGSIGLSSGAAFGTYVGTIAKYGEYKKMEIYGGVFAGSIGGALGVATAILGTKYLISNNGQWLQILDAVMKALELNNVNR